jgi:site-specific DNA recombinase
MMINSGPPPYGYRRRSGRLVADAKEAPVRWRIFEIFFEHQRKQTIAEVLNAEGYKTRSGTIWSGQSIARLLTDPIVTGADPSADAIVPQDLYDRCQDILKSQAAQGGAKRAPRHLFAGLLFCGCGDKMYVPSSTKKYVCSTCRSKIRPEELEAIVVDQLKRTTKADTPLASLLSHWASLSLSTKRDILETVCERIELSDKQLTLHLYELG